MRVAIAEDSKLIREMLADSLRAAGVQISASVATGDELIVMVRKNPPDAVLLDMRMPPTFTDEGIKTAIELRRLYPAMGILVLSQHGTPSSAAALFKAVGGG